MRYKMMGGIEQGIHYTTFMEDVEGANSEELNKKEGTTKSYGETADAKLDNKQSVLSDEGTIL